MISKFFIDRPRFALVISIVITIAGTISIFKLPVAQYPDITPPQVAITCSYPGASAKVVQETVIQPIESQVNGVEDMIYMESTSANDGSATITVTFNVGSDPDMNTVNVQNRVSIALPQLPEEVTRQGVTVKQKSSNMLLVINLFSPTNKYNAIYLSNYMSINIRDAILRVPGVGDANILGQLDYSMRIWLDPNRLTSLKMSPSEVISAIQNQNVQVAAGQIGAPPCSKDQQFQYTVQTKGRLTDVKEFENIIIRSSSDGAMVKVKDVARVELGAQSYSAFGELNNKPSTLLAIYQLNEANGLQLAQDIRKKLDELAQGPEFQNGDLKCEILYDTTKFIESSIDEVVKTLFEAVLLVILVVFIFLQDWRSTLIPTIAIPVSLIGTFAVLLALGYSINLTTLFGLILAIGIVVDDAIVVIENVNRLMDEEGLPPKDAAKKTMEEVTGPVIATTLVLLAVFVPVCFLPGITGQLYRQFAVTISISVVISSINALTLSPALSGCLLKPGKKKVWLPFVWFNKFFDGLTKGYSKLVGLLIRKAALVIIAYIGLMLFSVHLYNSLPTGFIPEEDQGAFFVNVQLPEAASIQRTYKVMREAAELIKSTPGVADVMTVTGYGMLSGTNSPNMGLIITVLKDWSERTTPDLSQEAIMKKVGRQLAQYPEAQMFAFAPPAIPGLGTTGGFEFILQSMAAADPQELAQVMGGLIVEANKQASINNAYSTFTANVPQVFLDIDREKVTKMGVNIGDLFTTIQAFFGSYYVNDFNKFGKVYKVMVQASKDYRDKIANIEGIYVKNKYGGMAPLGTILDITTKFGPEEMDRYNMLSSVTINGNAAPGYSSGQAMDTMEEVAKQTLPSGYKYEWTGMSYQEQLAGNQVVYIFALALLFIYLFLVAQYESWMIPLAVMLSVPVAFFGALGALWLAGLDNNIYTQVGFVLLFGLATKTAILIVEFAKVQHEEGKSIVEAAGIAANLRFRAVVMTAVSFILGVMPLVIAIGAGAASRRSLGTAVFGGMFVAGVIGTILIPAFYVVIQSLIEWGGKSKKAEVKPG